MLTHLAMLAAQAVSAMTSNCTYDRPAVLALNEEAFDQDVIGGWRRLDDAGCTEAAADLIRDWRLAHTADVRRRFLSFWHEGQLRAKAGQTALALALFDRSYKSPADDGRYGWNYYVDGSMAFLRRDRPAFDLAFSRLAALPRPADFDPTGPDGKPMAVSWPPNLGVLEGFRRCWGQAYRSAYAQACRPTSG